MSLLALSPAAFEARVTELGGRPFHARAARRHLLQRGLLSWDAMTDLPARLRETLARELPLISAVERGRSRSQDGTTKLLLELAGGATIETVHIPSTRPGRGATLCVSSQVGCPVGCPFCASGRLGLDRNLAPHEIVEQYLLGRSLGPLARSVVMGIGEPLLNAKSLVAALEVVQGELGLGARRITVSTVGYPERLRRLAPQRPPFQLAISLHSPDQDQRDRLVPAMAGTPIAEVVAAGDAWFEATGREVTYEYALLGDENDSPGHATRLAQLLRGHRATVNLIPYNPVPPLPFRRPHPKAVEAFRGRLEAAGLVATVRWSRGLEADAACGQLRLARTAGSDPRS